MGTRIVPSRKAQSSHMLILRLFALELRERLFGWLWPERSGAEPLTEMGAYDRLGRRRARLEDIEDVIRSGIDAQAIEGELKLLTARTQDQRDEVARWSTSGLPRRQAKLRRGPEERSGGCRSPAQVVHE